MTSAKIQLSKPTQRYLAKLKRGTARDALFRKILELMDRQAALTAAYISKNYLSGQRLNRITGTLARSVVGAAETFRGLPTMRVGVLTGPALAYAGILEVGTTDFNPDSPYGLPQSGRRPRFYLQDGMDWGVDQLITKLEELIAGVMEGRG